MKLLSTKSNTCLYRTFRLLDYRDHWIIGLAPYDPMILM